MLTFFRQNHFIRSLFLLVYAAVLKIPLFFYSLPEAPNSGYIGFSLLQRVQSKTGTIIISILIVFLAGAYLNKIVIENRITRESTLFPGLFLILISSIIPELGVLSPALLGLIPFIISLDYLLLLYKKTEYSGKVFNMGFWVSTASLFYFPYLYLALFIFLGISILKFIKIGDIFRILLGLVTPYLFILYYFIWQGNIADFTTSLFGNYFGRFGIPLPFTFDSTMKLTLIIILILIGVLNYGQYIKKKNVQAINKIDVLYWGTVFVGATLLIATPLTISHITLLLPFLASIMAMMFINIPNHTVAEILHLMLLSFGFYLHYITFV